MNNIVRKIPMIMLMVWPYVFILGLFTGGTSFFGIFCVWTIFLCIANILNAWKYCADNVAKELGFWGMLIKLIHMPFYVVAFVMGLVGLLSTVADSAGASSPFSLLFMFIMSMLLMIQSSAYCAKAVFTGRDTGIVKKETAMLLATSSFIMFADVICAILIYSKIKKNTKSKSY